jgi:hypothetical protein
MSQEFELLSPTDKPALLALSTFEYLATAQGVLQELEYKVHVASGHDDFTTRFVSVQYQVVVVEELFAATTPEENLTLINLQKMGMGLRRHATVILIGDSYTTMHPMQAFRQSVHAVVNRAELPSFKDILQKTITDNDVFLYMYRDSQSRLAAGKS